MTSTVKTIRLHNPSHTEARPACVLTYAPRCEALHKCLFVKALSAV